MYTFKHVDGFFSSFQNRSTIMSLLLSGDQGDSSCSSEVCQNHQKFNSLTPFQSFAA